MEPVHPWRGEHVGRLRVSPANLSEATLTASAWKDGESYDAPREVESS